MKKLQTDIKRGRKYFFATLLLYTFSSCDSEEMMQQIEDSPNLININTIEQLDAIRYDLDGDGKVRGDNKEAYIDAFGTPSCESSCKGYELRVSLNFSGSKWAEGATGDEAVAKGWNPIGAVDGESNQFTATFEGNSYTISNLYVNRPGFLGLFGRLGSSGRIYNLGVREVNINSSSNSNAYSVASALVGVK